MAIAYDYPLLGVFWSMMIFFLLVAWIMTLFHVIADIFRNHVMGGAAKAAWMIIILILPFIGVVIYLIANGNRLADQAIDNANAQSARYNEYTVPVG